MNTSTGNLFTNTSFRNGGRKAGIGICYDDYGDESTPGEDSLGSKIRVHLPHDNIKPEELNGPAIIVMRAKENL